MMTITAKELVNKFLQSHKENYAFELAMWFVTYGNIQAEQGGGPVKDAPDPEDVMTELITQLASQQLIADVKRLRWVVGQGLFSLGLLPINMHMIEMFTKALAATDRPEYKEGV